MLLTSAAPAHTCSNSALGTFQSKRQRELTSTYNSDDFKSHWVLRKRPWESSFMEWPWFLKVQTARRQVHFALELRQEICSSSDREIYSNSYMRAAVMKKAYLIWNPAFLFRKNVILNSEEVAYYYCLN